MLGEARLSGLPSVPEIAWNKKINKFNDLKRANPAWPGWENRPQVAFVLGGSGGIVERGKSDRTNVENSASQTTGIAKLYASSLFEVALAAKQLESVEKDLERFDSMMNASSDLKRLVRSPVFSAGDQLRAIEALISKAGITGLAANLIKVVARNRRLFIMPEMLGAFRKLLAQHRGAESAEVTVARPLSAAQEKELKAALKSSVGKDVAIDARVDPSLLGGMIVKIGSRQIDTSLRRKLSSLKLALKEVG